MTNPSSSQRGRVIIALSENTCALLHRIADNLPDSEADVDSRLQATSLAAHHTIECLTGVNNSSATGFRTVSEAKIAGAYVLKMLKYLKAECDEKAFGTQPDADTDKNAPKNTILLQAVEKLINSNVDFLLLAQQAAAAIRNVQDAYAREKIDISPPPDSRFREGFGE